MLIHRTRLPAWLRRNRSLAVAGYAVSVATIAALSLWTTRRVPAAAPAPDDRLARQIEAAIAATRKTVLANSGAPKDPASVKELVSELWPMLYPELANRLRARDPDYVQALERAVVVMARARELDAELLKNAAVRAHREETLQAFQRGMRSPQEAEERVIRQARRLR